MSSGCTLKTSLFTSLLIPLASVGIVAISCASDEVCDWEDNDRDGIIDEGFDADGDGVWACGLSAVHYDAGDYDCDDHNPEISPEAVEMCDGVDNDCTGVADEGCADVLMSTEYPIVQMVPMDIDGDGNEDILALGELVVQLSDSSVLLAALGDESRTISPLNPVYLESNLDILGIAVYGQNEGGLTDIVTVQDTLIVRMVQDELGVYSLDLEESVYLIFESELGFFELDSSGIVFLAGPSGDNASRIHMAGVWDFETDQVYGYTFNLEDDTINLVASNPWNVVGDVHDLYAQDIDLDGVRDEVLLAGNTLAWRYGLASSEALFGEATIELEEEPYSSALIQVDSDGLPDIVYSLPRRRRLYWRRNVGGAFSNQQIEIGLPFRKPGLVSSFDRNQDGISDLVVTSFDEAQVALFDGVGNGLFTLSCLKGITPDPRTLTIWPSQPSPAGQGVLIGHENGTVTFVGGDDCE